MTTHAQHTHLTRIHGLSAEHITALLDRAAHYLALNRTSERKLSTLRGKTQINLFIEPSTRTRMSFELAGKRLGADVVSMSASHSSLTKGESLRDTALTLAAMRPDVIVIRHPESGAADFMANHVTCAVINAGDGCHEHPTQALLDALTMREQLGRLDHLTVTICGDILHSRVARSNIHLLTTMRAKVRVVAPATLIPPGIDLLGCQHFTSLDDAITDTNVLMMLRLQRERMQGSYVPSTAEYAHFYGLNDTRLAALPPDAIIMHPGPLNRGVEITDAAADHAKQSMILNQVEAGVALRQAILEICTQSPN